MLSDEVIEKVTERLVKRLENVNLYTLKKIAKKIKQIKTLSSSDSHRLAQIMQYGGDYDKIVKELAKITQMNTKEIYEIFREVAKSNYEFAEKFYKYREKKYIPWEENIVLRNQVDAIAEQTAKKYVNFSNTTGIGFSIKDKEGNVIFKDVSSTYQDTIDKAILSISQGQNTFDNEMYSWMKEIGSSGLKYIEYASGYSRRLDTSLRMALRDGLRQLHNETQIQFGKEFESDGVEISVHPYPAPDHAEVQGRQFSNEEFEKFQNDIDCVDYKGKEFPAEFEGHDRRSISEYNCYHTIFSIVLGVSNPRYSDEELKQIITDNEKGFDYENKHYTLYEGTQLQRKIESEIRKQKDLQIIGKESDNEKLIQESQKRINQLTQKYKELSDVSGLPTLKERLRVSGYHKVKVND